MCLAAAWSRSIETLFRHKRCRSAGKLFTVDALFLVAGAEINCGSPGPVYNGWIENAEQKTSLGTSVIYRCFDGMKRIGASSATCEKSGRWSYNPPQCLCT